MLLINFVEYVHVCFVLCGVQGHDVTQAEAHIAALSQQLEEVFQIRETEAEELLRRQEAQYHAQLQGAFALLLSSFPLTSFNQLKSY